MHEGKREPGVSGSWEVGRPGCVSLHSIFRAVCLECCLVTSLSLGFSSVNGRCNTPSYRPMRGLNEIMHQKQAVLLPSRALAALMSTHAPAAGRLCCSSLRLACSPPRPLPGLPLLLYASAPISPHPGLFSPLYLKQCPTHSVPSSTLSLFAAVDILYM